LLSQSIAGLTSGVFQMRNKIPVTKAIHFFAAGKKPAIKTGKTIRPAKSESLPVKPLAQSGFRKKEQAN